MNSYMNVMSSLKYEQIKDEELNEDNDNSYYCFPFLIKKKQQQETKKIIIQNQSLLRKNRLKLEDLQEVQIILETQPERKAIQKSSQIYKSIYLEKCPIILTYRKENINTEQFIKQDKLTLIISYPELKLSDLNISTYNFPFIIQAKIVEQLNFENEDINTQIYYVGILQNINQELCDEIIVIPFSPSLSIIDEDCKELKLECQQALFNILVSFAIILEKVTLILPSTIPLNNILSVCELLISVKLRLSTQYYQSLIVNCCQEMNRFGDFQQYKITFDQKVYQTQILQLLKSQLQTDQQIEILQVQHITPLLWTNKPLLKSQFQQLTNKSQIISPLKRSDSGLSPPTPFYNYGSNYKIELETSDLRKEKDSY